jgi:hypothetical protein
MRVHWATLLTVATLMTMGSARALAQIGGGSAEETGGLPEQMNSTPMGSREHPVRVPSGVMASLLLHRELPVYPEGVRGGALVMAATIDREGKVATLKVLSGSRVYARGDARSGSQMDLQAISAERKLRIRTDNDHRQH